MEKEPGSAIVGVNISRTTRSHSHSHSHSDLTVILSAYEPQPLRGGLSLYVGLSIGISVHGAKDLPDESGVLFVVK